MLYVQQSLGNNEELIDIGKFHWMYTVTAFMSIFWSLLATAVFLVGAVEMYKQLGKFPPHIEWATGIQYLEPGLRIFAFVIFVLGLLRFANMMIVKATTEIAVTNSRLIYKTGLVARNVGEISIDRIEGVDVRQSIWGRIFNYGRLAIRGMGVGEVVLPPIEDPIVFRRSVQKAKELKAGGAGAF